nr:hypothetical protein [Candidatus Sigynarchaeota archaeon]
MGKTKKDDDMPFDFSSLFDQFKENIKITKDKNNDAVIIQFKKMAPGVSIDMLKSMIENTLGAGSKNMMKKFSKLMNDDEEKGDEDQAEDDDEADGEEEDSGPGFRVDTLEDGTGFRLVPNDPADLDELYDSINSMFDPEMFTKMMSAAFQLFGLQPPGPAGTPPPDDKNVKENKKKGDDTNMTRDYFYT